MLNLDLVEQAFSSIEEIGKGRISFEIRGIPVTLELLSPEQELQANKYANLAFEEEEDREDGVATMDYFEKYRIAVLSRSLIELNGVDLSAEFIETGKVLSNNVPEKKPRVQIVRELIEKKLSKQMRSALFNKYGELVEKIDKETEDLVVLDPSDYDAEIQRLENKLQELNALKEETLREKAEEAGVGDLDKFNKDHAPTRQELNPSALNELRKQQEVPVVDSDNESISDQLLPPHMRSSQETQRSSVIPPVAPPPERHGGPPTPPVNPMFEMEDSFATSEDEIQRLNQELLRRRMGVAQDPSTNLSILNQGRNWSPHAGASEVNASLEHEQINALKEAQELGTVDGRQAYKLPPQIIDERTVGGRQMTPPSPIKSTRNPRFQGPKK